MLFDEGISQRQAEARSKCGVRLNCYVMLRRENAEVADDEVSMWSEAKRRPRRTLPTSALSPILTASHSGAEVPGVVTDFRVCRVGPGNFTPSPSQIRT